MTISIYDAAVSRDEVMLDRLISNNVDFNYPHWPDRKQALLHILASEDNKAALEFLIRKSIKLEIEVKDDLGYTPLHVASELGNERFVEALIEYRAKVDTLTRRGDTALYLAVENRRKSVVKLFLRHGAANSYIQWKYGDGDSALHRAAFHGYVSILTDLLSACPASDFVDLQNDKGRTALHYAAGKGNVEAVLVLLEHGAKKLTLDADGAKPFHFAARCGLTIIMEILMDAPDAANRVGLTALHYAAWNGHHEAVKWLINNAASVNATDKAQEDTALHWAARKGSSDVIRTLVLGGADICAVNKKGELAMGLADECKNGDAVKAMFEAATSELYKKRINPLEKHTNGANLLHYAAGYATVDAIQLMLSLIKELGGRTSVNKTDNEGRNPVHWAAMKGNMDAIIPLSNCKADLNADRMPPHHETPLCFALSYGKMEFAKELLRCNSDDDKIKWTCDIHEWLETYYRSSDLNFDDLRNEFMNHMSRMIRPTSLSYFFSELPPIYLALNAGREDIAMFVQQHSRGVEDAVNKKGKMSGCTALHWATIFGQKEIVAQLCRISGFGEKLIANAEDKLGKTALQYAREMKLRDIDRELMERSDVQSYVEGLYRDRQVYADSANAVLVSGALIASVAFAGWLQPPLNYTLYYNLPSLPSPPAPPQTLQSYAAIEQHVGIRVFWVFNSLSFFFAIATVLAVVGGMLPMHDMYIGTRVRYISRALFWATLLLAFSIVFILGAFAAAGFAILPPLFKYQAYMISTVIVGATPCIILLIWFFTQYRISLEPRQPIRTRILSCFRENRERDSRDSPHLLSSSETHKHKQYVKVGSQHHSIPWDDGLDSLSLPASAIAAQEEGPANASSSRPEQVEIQEGPAIALSSRPEQLPEIEEAPPIASSSWEPRRLELEIQLEQ